MHEDFIGTAVAVAFMELVVQSAERDVTGFLVAFGGLGGHAQCVVLELYRTIGAVGLAGMIEAQGVRGEPFTASAQFDIAFEKGLVTRTDVQIVRDDVRGLACRVGGVIGQWLEKWQIIGMGAQLPIGAVGFLILSLCIRSGKQAQTGKE